MGKGNRKHFDMGSSKWAPIPKVKPEDIFKTQVSNIPVLSKDSKGKTLVSFPEISVSSMFPPKKEEETTNIHRLEAEVDLMKEDASELPLEKGEVFVRSFLAQIKRRFKMLIRHINFLRDESVRLTAEDEAIRAIAEKADSDLWDVRMEFDALKNQMDAILEIFEGWGVPVGTFSASETHDDVPFDVDRDSVEISGEDVASLVRAEQKEVEKTRLQKVQEHNDRILKKFNDGKTITISSARGVGAEAAKQMLLGEGGNTSRPISTTTWPEKKDLVAPTKKATPTPPTDIKKSEKTNSKQTTYYKGNISHYCDMCKFSAPDGGQTGRAVRCKNEKSKWYNEVVYGLKDCDAYQSTYSTPSRMTEIFGFDFSDKEQVTH